MPVSIESFVKKLQSEGIDSGKKAAEKIQKEARRDAEKILSDAKAEAEKILNKAKVEADKQLSRARSELELVARDTLLKLRESIARGLTKMLAQNIETKLSDPDYLAEILQEVIAAYAQADANELTSMEVNISKKTREKLNDSVLKDLFRNLGDKHDAIALRATLTKAGFEYKIHGATVEVSPDSLSELILEMVTPTLQETLDKFFVEKNEKLSIANHSNTK